MSPASRRTLLFVSAWLCVSRLPPASAETLKTAPVSGEVAARWSGSVTKALGDGKLEADELKELASTISGLKELDLSVPEVKASVQPVLAEIETEAYAVISALEASGGEAGYPDGLIARSWILRDQLHPYLDSGLTGWLEQVAPRAVDAAAEERVQSMLAALSPALEAPPAGVAQDEPPAVAAREAPAIRRRSGLLPSRRGRNEPIEKAERSQIFDEHGKMRPEMMGVEGYLRYADRYAAGRMRTVFDNVRLILTKKEFLDLGWGLQFWGTTAEYRAVRGRVLDAQGGPKPEMMGPEGYRAYVKRYAERESDLNMLVAYRNVSAVLSKKEFKSLGWGHQFYGTPEEHLEIPSRVLEADGRPKPGMAGPEGYIAYAERYHGGQMLRAYMNVVAGLTEEEFARLDWGKVFPGATAKYRSIRAEIFDEGGRVREGLTGAQGYIAYSDRHTDGKMMLAYSRVAAVLTESEFRKLDWGRQFSRSTTEYKAVRSRVLDADGRPLPGMRGREGYLAYADRFTDRQMGAAYANVRAVLTDTEFARLEWGKNFSGTTVQYRAVRDQIYGEDGRPRPEVLGRAGYVSYSDKHADTEMSRAFRNVSAVLSDEEFAELGWGRLFSRTTTEFAAYRALLIGADGAFRAEARGDANLRRLAVELSGAEEGRKYWAARQNLRAAIDDDELARSGWRIKKQ